MATNVSTVVSHFPEAQNGFTTTLASTISASATTVPLNSVAGYTNGRAAVFIVDPTDAVKKQVFTGIIDTAGVQVTGVKWTSGTDQTHTGGATVVDYTTATHNNMITKGLKVEHKDTGAHSDIHADSIEATTATITNAIVTNLTVGGQTPSPDWTTIATAPNHVTYNGQRSYSLVFDDVDYTNILSPGQRLKTTRTVAAPTQCTSLNGTTQYYKKATPNKLTFTTVFTVSAWVKLSSYAAGGVIARRNATTEGWSLLVDANGTVALRGLKTAGNNKVITSYQSLPLNKWVHIAATLDMSAADTAAQKIWIDGIEVPRAYVLTGTATTLVQGTTDLTIGCLLHDYSNPFPGKIAQAAVFDAALSEATIRSQMSQGLAGTETNLLSAYSFNNAITDLNTTTPNDLTAVGSAVATNADSPFGTQASGLISSTLDYGIVQSAAFSVNTTVVVQVPEGCTIPTSGGVSAVSYSGLKAPYGFPLQENRWTVESISRVSGTVSTPTATTWYNLTPTSGTYGGMVITVPIGNWKTEYSSAIKCINNTNYPEIYATISTANNTESDTELTTYYKAQGTSAGSMAITLYKSKTVNYAAQASYYFNVKTGVASSASITISGDLVPTIIAIKNALL